MMDIFTQSTGAVHSAQNDAARTSVQEYCCCNNLSVRLYFPRVIQGIDDVLTGAGYSIVLKIQKFPDTGSGMPAGNFKQGY